MTGLICNTRETLEVRSDGLRELVRGREHELLERMTPVVRTQDLLLDLDGVERIDAAGISALITLYRTARTEGHQFGIVNVSVRVSEILKVVGLDRILIRPDAVADRRPIGCLSRSAA